MEIVYSIADLPTIAKCRPRDPYSAWSRLSAEARSADSREDAMQAPKDSSESSRLDAPQPTHEVAQPKAANDGSPRKATITHSNASQLIDRTLRAVLRRQRPPPTRPHQQLRRPPTTWQPHAPRPKAPGRRQPLDTMHG